MFDFAYFIILSRILRSAGICEIPKCKPDISVSIFIWVLSYLAVSKQSSL
jgi:hypothetical protein